MKEREQRMAAKKFAADWKNKGYEKGDSQPFWIALLRNVYGVEEPEQYIAFEEQAHIDHTTGFIDGYISATHVLIEQKGLDKNLNKPIKQSDGTLLNPYQQAKRYSMELPYSKRPRWIVTCNFSTFYVYDMENPSNEPEVILLENLEREYYRLQFLVDTEDENIRKEMEVSIQAGELVGVLYDAFMKQYIDPTKEESMQSLNMLCVRLVFCLYAEDAEIFGKKNMFYDYLSAVEVKDARRALLDLFQVLDTVPEKRDPYMDESLAAFPYVNGGLFADEHIEIPQFNEEIYEILLKKASADFDWSDISPTIFGAVFESTLNPETRRSGGMHYTSIENIHKVIDPLFLDGLQAEFEGIMEVSVLKARLAKLEIFQEKLAGLTFLDPACGSGNFLTETYISLRRLENEIIKAKMDATKGVVSGQITFGSLGGDSSPIKVSIRQFYGIEINDFAVTVAKTALWIAESQMLKETEDIVHMNLDFLPLKSYINIVEANALQIDWESVVPKNKLDYIMGNPPFVGYSLQSKEQKHDILTIYVDENRKPYKTAGKIDYVSGWYFKAAKWIQGTNIHAAFVSTNSITQGEQVAGVWKPLYERFGIHIDFAHRTFRWDSEASLKAHVHCVIVGFSTAYSTGKRKLYEDGRMKEVDSISPYLIEGDVVFAESRKTPVCNVPEMIYGNKPTDGGFLFFTEEEKNDALSREPFIAPYFRQIYGASEYINGKKRYCLWLVECQPADIRKSAIIRERVEKIRQFRLNSPKRATQESALMPTLFQEIRQPLSEYIIVPIHTSENRSYIPFGFVSADILVNNAVQMIPDATLYHFGVLTSNVHMAWVKAVCGRIKSDFRYSKDIVYNNFPWPQPTEEQTEAIEKTAQGILDARMLYPDSSLADLYDDLAMPPELRKAHQDNDRAVMKAYGFSVKEMTASSCVAELMRMYQELKGNKS